MRKILYLFFALTLSACTSEVQVLGLCIQFDTMEDCKDVKSLFGGLDYALIPLQMDSVSTPFVGMKMIVTDDYIALGDKFYSHAVYLYDTSGRFRKKIGTRGGASNEYPVFKDFSIWKDTISVASLGSPGDCFYQYGLDGKFINKKEIPEGIISFARNSKGEYLINSGKNIYNSPWQLTLYTSGFEVIGRYFELDEGGNNIPTYEDNFSVYDECFYFHEAFNNQLYLCDDEDMRPSYYLDFGEKNDFGDMSSGDFVKSMDRLQKEGFYMVNGYLETDSLVCMVLSYLKDNETKHQSILCYEKNIDRGRTIKLSDTDLFVGNICIEGSVLYCMVSDKFVDEFTDETIPADSDVFILKIFL